MVNNTTSCFCWCSLNRLDLACFRTASAELLWCVNKLKRWTAPVMRAPFGTWAGYRRYVQTFREWSWQRTCGSMFFTWKSSRCFVSLSVTHTENCSNRCLDMMSACWLVLFMFSLVRISLLTIVRKHTVLSRLGCCQIFPQFCFKSPYKINGNCFTVRWYAPAASSSSSYPHQIHGHRPALYVKEQLKQHKYVKSSLCRCLW